MHVELYPNLRELKAEDHEELRNILIQAIAGLSFVLRKYLH